MRAEGSQISTLCGIFGMWHGIPKQIACGIHFIFLCLQVHFPDVERVEWLNKVRSSELQSVRLCALSWIPAQTLSLRRLVSYYNKVQSQRRLYLSFGASGVLVRARCVHLADVDVMNLSTRLHSEILKPKVHVHVCTHACMSVWLYYYLSKSSSSYFLLPAMFSEQVPISS